MSHFISWLCDKFYSCIYGKQEYTQLNNCNGNDFYFESRFEHSRLDHFISNDEPRNLPEPEPEPEPDQEINERLLESCFLEDPQPIDSDSEPDFFEKINHVSKPGLSEFGLNSVNSIIINSYKDDPIERISAPSPRM